MTLNKLVLPPKKLHTLGVQQSHFSREMTPLYWTQAIQELAACDTVMHQLIRQFEDATLTSRGCAFTTLARSIVGQQISVKAAESVWQKVIGAIPDMTPLRIIRTKNNLPAGFVAAFHRREFE